MTRIFWPQNMLRRKIAVTLPVVLLVGIILFFPHKSQTGIEFLCAANGHNKSDDTNAAIIGQNGYFTDNGALMRWNMDEGIVRQVSDGNYYKLQAYNDELYYFDSEAIVAWDPLMDTHKALYQIPDGETVFDFFLYHDMLFYMTTESMTVYDISSESTVLVLDDVSVVDITHAVMNDELYLLITDFHDESKLLKYSEKKQCFELLESGLIQNLYNTGEWLLYQRCQEDWTNGSEWKVYHQGKESPLEIKLGTIIGTTSKGIVLVNDDWEFFYWDGENVLELNVPEFESHRLIAYVCTGTHLVAIDKNAQRVYTTALG